MVGFGSVPLRMVNVARQFTYVTFCLDHWYLVIQWTLFSYVARQFTYVTFCLDHWYLVIQWTLFNISSWNLCLPFLSLTTTFSLKTVLCPCVFESLPELFILL